MQAKLIIGLLCVFCSNTLHADYNADDLQKLFTDKRQRSQIDAARSGNHIGIEKHTSKVSVSGYMTRSDGKSVVWMNNANTLDNSAIGDVRVHQSNVGKNNKVTISVDGKTTKLRPGEVWDKETGKIVDNH